VKILAAAIVLSSTPPEAATTALNTKEASHDEHHHGRHGNQAEEGRERGTVEDGLWPDGLEEGVDQDSDEVFGYGHGTPFWGMLCWVGAWCGHKFLLSEAEQHTFGDDRISLFIDQILESTLSNIVTLFLPSFPDNPSSSGLVYKNLQLLCPLPISDHTYRRNIQCAEPPGAT
jgi:hypothetical protein